jgi:hypothetical protein
LKGRQISGSSHSFGKEFIKFSTKQFEEPVPRLDMASGWNAGQKTVCICGMSSAAEEISQHTFELYGEENSVCSDSNLTGHSSGSYTVLGQSDGYHSAPSIP